MVIIKESEMMVGTCNFPYCRGDVKYWLGDVGSPFGAGFMICEECAHQLKESFREMFPQEPVEVPAEVPEVPAEVPVVDTVAQDELAEAIEVAVKEVKEAQEAVKEIAKKAPPKRAPAKRKAPAKKATAK